MTTERAPGLAPGWYDDPLGHARMRYWDGAHWTQHTSQSKTPETATQRGPLSKGFASLSDWLSRLLTVQALVGLAWGGLLLWAQSVLGGTSGSLIALADPSSATYSTQEVRSLTHIALIGLALSLVQLLLSVATAVMWLCWQHQLASRCPGPQRRSPALQLFSWVIPIVSYWWPYQDLNAIWRGYGRDENERRSPAPAVVGLWWMSWIGRAVVVGLLFGVSLSQAMVRAVQQPGVAPASGGSSVGVLALVVVVLMIVSAMLAASVVRTMSWRALSHFASVSA